MLGPCSTDANYSCRAYKQVKATLNGNSYSLDVKKLEDPDDEIMSIGAEFTVNGDKMYIAGALAGNIVSNYISTKPAIWSDGKRILLPTEGINRFKVTGVLSL